ncbi:type I-F CRISPR-associated protein Csy2 [Halorhodospira neutriphila]|uniref:Type I-F CRISPR-associated protein Csy2 n=1 Tax=Halorhodospira neutriphila TaxID=168379 RepID=A0ABS1E2V2_9GAMM|nr:type I-F CRISPR-associated protein Csy2 [Halorhodospira neutriphila]MBK1726031.1 type I-F CRISPR-associated protein Csy2 [Halorhodospira neutriphila]
MSELSHLLVIPWVRVQNANAVSSPHTWGFPAMSAFVGLMHALERTLARQGTELQFEGVGVVCHRHEPQASRSGYTHAFHLTRNPLNKKGETPAIVEEGRTHMEITLIFDVDGEACHGDAEQRARLAREVTDALMTLRVAGGSVQPAAVRRGRTPAPRLERVDEREEERQQQYRRLLRSWLPGFALVSRDDLLQQHWQEMQDEDPQASLLDAWLDLSRLNMECYVDEPGEAGSEVPKKFHWEARRPAGWIVPIPVGYGALGPLHEAGTVEGARDMGVPFRFVESLLSIGEWKSPHRLSSPEELLWYVSNREQEGLYRLCNDYPSNASDAI